MGFSRLIGLGAALTILFAYQPPSWIKSGGLASQQLPKGDGSRI